MHAHGAIAPAQVAPHSHDGPARAHARDDRVRHQVVHLELHPDLAAGAAIVRARVVFVGELVREECVDVLFIAHALCELFRFVDAPQESALVAADQDHVRTHCAYQIDALDTHPIRHEHVHRMTQRAPDSGKRDSRVSAGGLDDGLARFELAAAVGAPDDVERHAVLDAPGHVEEFSLGVDHATAAAVAAFDGEHRRVADEPAETQQAALDVRTHSGSHDDLQCAAISIITPNLDTVNGIV